MPPSRSAPPSPFRHTPAQSLVPLDQLRVWQLAGLAPSDPRARLLDDTHWPGQWQQRQAGLKALPAVLGTPRLWTPELQQIVNRHGEVAVPDTTALRRAAARWIPTATDAEILAVLRDFPADWVVRVVADKRRPLDLALVPAIVATGRVGTRRLLAWRNAPTDVRAALEDLTLAALDTTGPGYGHYDLIQRFATDPAWRTPRFLDAVTAHLAARSNGGRNYLIQRTASAFRGSEAEVRRLAAALAAAGRTEPLRRLLRNPATPLAVVREFVATPLDAGTRVALARSAHAADPAVRHALARSGQVVAVWRALLRHASGAEAGELIAWIAASSPAKAAYHLAHTPLGDAPVATSTVARVLSATPHHDTRERLARRVGQMKLTREPAAARPPRARRPASPSP